MRRRDCRWRRLTLDTQPAAAACLGDGVAPSIIDTTSVAIEWKADGSLSKVNQYIVIRDLGQGSSAEVRLCRRMRHGGESKTGNNLEGVGAAREGESGQEERATEADMAQSFVEGDDDSGLYAIKIYDRAKMMKRGARFARDRERRPDGVSLEEAQPPELFVKVQQEITIMKKLAHPNIVQLIEVMDDPLASSLFMVMCYVERGSIMHCVEPERGRYASPITGGCFDAPTAARYFADILTGLEFLHLQLIAHRDLKPENVLLGNDDRARITDFGASQYFADDARRTPKSACSLARSSSRAQIFEAEGTWSFWAPEMCGARGEGAAFNAYATDAWAAGVTLWCFLYGAVPFFSSNPMELFEAITTDPAPIPDGADDTLRGFLEHLLDKSPEMRLSVTEALGHPWIRMRLLVGAGEKAFLPSAGDVGDPGGVSRDVDDGIKDARTTAATNSAITERAGDQGGRSSWW
ncbi:unnamed protein product [Ascophyllum nodosum]